MTHELIDSEKAAELAANDWMWPFAITFVVPFLANQLVGAGALRVNETPTIIAGPIQGSLVFSCLRMPGQFPHYSCDVAWSGFAWLVAVALALAPAPWLLARSRRARRAARLALPIALASLLLPLLAQGPLDVRCVTGTTARCWIGNQAVGWWIVLSIAIFDLGMAAGYSSLSRREFAPLAS